MSLIILHVRVRTQRKRGICTFLQFLFSEKKIASLFETRTEPENLLLYTGFVVHQRLLL